MSKTLLLLKLLRGDEVRSRSFVGRQSVYATLQVNQEVEVRSSTSKDGGSAPEFNQLFLIELGPWWKGKEIVLQLFCRNKMMADQFIGGCSCKLGELVRAVGLDESGEALTPYTRNPAASSNSPGAPILSGSASVLGSSPMSPGTPASSSDGGASGGSGNLAPVPGKVCFQRVSAAEVRHFGELLPVLPGEDTDQQQQEDGSNRAEHGGRNSASASEHAAAGASSAARAASHGSSPGAHRTSSSVSLSHRTASPSSASPHHPKHPHRARSHPLSSSPSPAAPSALPITWLILRHGGGPASLKHYPAPGWHLPAGRIAVYLDFITLPISSIPRVISGGGGGSQHASASPNRPGAAVSLPSTILPNGWLGMSDNEKLSWAWSHRRERAAPVPQAMGGLVAAVARSILGASGSGGNGSNGAGFNAPIYGSGQPGSVGPNGVSAGSIAASSSSSSSSSLAHWPFPWFYFRSLFLSFSSSPPSDRCFYAWYFVLGLTTLSFELLFQREHAGQHPKIEWKWWGWGGPAEQAEGEGAGDKWAVVPFDASAAPDAAAAETDFFSSGGWMSGYFFDLHLLSLSLGILVLKLGWNMLSETQISQPWRRLDLILTLVLGFALGAATQVGFSGNETTRALGAMALAATHAYARATLYQSEIVSGVLSVRRGGRVATLAPLASPSGSGNTAGLIQPPFIVSHWRAVGVWTARSLVDSGRVGMAWITGKASRAGGGGSVTFGSPSSASAAAAASIAAAAASHGAHGAHHPHAHASGIGHPHHAGSAHKGIPGSIQLCLRSAFFLLGSLLARWLLLPLPVALRWWLPPLTSSAALSLAVPSFVFLLLFMLGRDIALLKGKPWLCLFALNSSAMLVAGVRIIPPLAGLIATAVGIALWESKWSLMGLAGEWALAAALVPQAVWEMACPTQTPIQVPVQIAIPLVQQQQQQPSQTQQQQQHSHPLQPPHLNLQLLQQQQQQQQQSAGALAGEKLHLAPDRRYSSAVAE